MLKVGGIVKSLVKSSAKTILQAVFSKPVSGLHSIEFTDYDVVSFDIFDTLVVRTSGKPSSIFWLTGEYYYGKDSHSLIRKYVSDRIRAESEARIAKQSEISVFDIYRHFHGRNQAELHELCDIEQACELAFAECRVEVGNVFSELLASHRIVLISDMYLPHMVIEEILNKAGLSDYEKLYVSCDTLVTKQNGQLFDLVLNDLGIAPNQMLHIGDNPLGDWLRPRQKRIDSYLIQTAG